MLEAPVIHVYVLYVLIFQNLLPACFLYHYTILYYSNFYIVCSFARLSFLYYYEYTNLYLKFYKSEASFEIIINFLRNLTFEKKIIQSPANQLK